MSEETKKTEETTVSPVPEVPQNPQAETPLTRDELAAKIELLSERARAAGISPLQALLASYADRGLKILDGFLGALEDDKRPPKASPTPPAQTPIEKP